VAQPGKQSKKLSEDEMLKVIGDLLVEVSKSSNADKGSCVYHGGFDCKDGVTEDWCDKVGGSWTKGGQCP
jgi:hypothetical protein